MRGWLRFVLALWAIAVLLLVLQSVELKLFESWAASAHKKEPRSSSSPSAARFSAAVGFAARQHSTKLAWS